MNNRFLLLKIDAGLLPVAIIALFVIIPFLQPGLPATADTPIHFYRALEFSQSWGPGVVYPRWSPNLAYGYGYPLWDFAPPLPYLIPLVVRGLGFSLETGMKVLVLLTVSAYAGGSYLLARQWLGPYPALVGAAIYTLAPFALREALLYGGNYPQYLAIGLYPWVVWSLGRIHRRPSPGNVLLTAVLYGAVILSHLFHALIISPVAAAYALMLWLPHPRRRRSLIASALALGLGLLLTAFFWLPAFVERAYTRATEDVYLVVSPLLDRFLSPAELLALPLPPDTQAANPAVSFSLGIAAGLLAVIGLIRLILPRVPMGLKWHGLFFALLGAICVLMTLPVSAPVWLTVPLLAVAEFPWRLLGLANLSLAYLGSLAVWLPNAAPRRQTGLSLLAVMLVLATAAVYLYPLRPFIRYPDSLAAMRAYEQATGTIGTTTLGEYLPPAVKIAPTQSIPDRQKLDRAALPPAAAATLLQHTATTDSYRITTDSPFTVRFFTFYFPGWTAQLNGKPAAIMVEPDTGLITVAVPAGTHTVSLAYIGTPLQNAVNIISIITLLGSAGLSLWLLRHRTDEFALTKATQPVTGWAFCQAIIAGMVLLGLLLAKTVIIDPHTGWFRRQSPPGTVIGLQHPLAANLDDSVTLLGYDLDNPTPRPGDTVRVVLYWLARRNLDINYRSFVHLDSPLDGRTWAGSDHPHPGDATAQIDVPTSTWDTTRYVRDEFSVTIPVAAPPVLFNLRAGLYNPQTGIRLPVKGSQPDSDTVTLQLLTLSAPPRRQLPAAATPTDHRLGDSIRLAGWHWDQPQALLTLFWQTDHPLTDNYVVFVHLLNPEGTLARGADSPPVEGLYPTSAWIPGTLIVDRRGLDLAGLAPGTYTLTVGLYNVDTQVRLPVADAAGEDGVIRLGQITIDDKR